MAGTFSQSYQLVQQSWRVLRQDKELVLVPVFLAIVSTLVLALFVVLGYYFETRYALFGSASPYRYVLIFVYYLSTYFVVSFFSAVLATCVAIRMKGGNPTLRDGINNAMAHFGTLLAWSLVSATVGLILRAIFEKVGVLGRVMIWLVGLVWSLATFFIIPVLVLENLGVGKGIKRSKEIFLKTWGQNAIGGIGMGLFFGVIFLVGLVIATITIILISKLAQPRIPSIVIGALFVVFILILAVISSTLTNIFHVALYNYAATGIIPPGISPDLIQQAFKSKTSNH